MLDTGRTSNTVFGDPAAKPGPGRLFGPTKSILSSSQPATRTQAIQTDYMEREAQTDPYTPEYVVKPGEQPEVLTLATLMYSMSSKCRWPNASIDVLFFLSRERSSSRSCRSGND